MASGRRAAASSGKASDKAIRGEEPTERGRRRQKAAWLATGQKGAQAAWRAKRRQSLSHRSPRPRSLAGAGLADGAAAGAGDGAPDGTDAAAAAAAAATPPPGAVAAAPAALCARAAAGAGDGVPDGARAGVADGARDGRAVGRAVGRANGRALPAARGGVARGLRATCDHRLLGDPFAAHGRLLGRRRLFWSAGRLSASERRRLRASHARAGNRGACSASRRKTLEITGLQRLTPSGLVP